MSCASLLPIAHRVPQPCEPGALLHGVGSTDTVQGKAGRGTSVAREGLSSSAEMPAWNQSSSANQCGPPMSSDMCLAMAGRRQREGSTGREIPFCHLISRKCSKGAHCLSLTRSSTGKSVETQRTCMNVHPTCMTQSWLQLAENLLHPRTFCPRAHLCIKEKHFV